MATSPRHPPIAVLGSANADICLQVDRIPKPGETVAAQHGHTFPGGKGANQAACAARLSCPAYFIGQVGRDSHGSLIRDSLRSCGVRLDHLADVPHVPTGHAVLMLQPGGQNSIIVAGGANLSWPRLEDGISRLTFSAQQLIRRAGALLLQREVPEAVNLEAAKIARSANIPVILDTGGMDGPISGDLLRCVTVLSPNETELGRLTGMEMETFEDIVNSSRKCQDMGVKRVLVKLGERGSILLTEDGHLFRQPAIPAPYVLDTTGASDTFTASFAVALVEGQSPVDALRFAAAAVSLCVRVKGAIPSMPDRKAVIQLLQETSSQIRAEE